VIALAFGSCGVLGGFAFWFGTSLDAKARNLHSLLSEAHAAGIYTEVSDLIVQAPPDEDAWPEIEAGYSEWRKLPKSDRNLVLGIARGIFYNRNEDVAIERLNALEAKAPAVFERLRAAGARSECSVQKPELWRDRATMAKWDYVREGIRLLACQAILAEKSGRRGEVESLLIEASRLVRFLGAQRSYLPLTQQCAGELELQRALTRIIYLRAQDPSSTAALIRREQERLGPMVSARDVLTGDLALVNASLNDPKENGMENIPGEPMFADAAQAGVTEIWTHFYRQLPTDPEDLNGAEKVLMQMSKTGEQTPLYGRYVKNYEYTVPLFRDVLARRRLADMAATILESRAAGKGDAVDPSKFVDPDSGEPMKMIRRDHELVLYSYGRDMKDNHGKEREYGRDASLVYDVLLRLPD
jgi:hypothetical protein